MIDALIFSGDLKEETCPKCGGLGYTIEEREEDGELIQWEAKCECRLKDEDETDKYE